MLRIWPKMSEKQLNSGVQTSWLYIFELLKPSRRVWSVLEFDKIINEWTFFEKYHPFSDRFVYEPGMFLWNIFFREKITKSSRKMSMLTDKNALNFNIRTCIWRFANKNYPFSCQMFAWKMEFQRYTACPSLIRWPQWTWIQFTIFFSYQVFFPLLLKMQFKVEVFWGLKRNRKRRCFRWVKVEAEYRNTSNSMDLWSREKDFFPLLILTM